MSILKFARNAAIIAAAASLPAQAIAAAPVSSAFDTIRAAATLDEENDQFAGWNDFIVPAVVVVAVGLGIYFIVDSNEDEGPTLPTSP